MDAITDPSPIWRRNLELVRAILDTDCSRIAVLHVEERHFGAAMHVSDAFRHCDVDVQELNQAYERQGLVDGLSRHLDPAEALPRIFADQGPRVVKMSGWGSDPRSADALLKAIYPHVTARADLRLVVLNNASPVPHMITYRGPTAHPDPEEFASHVAGLTRTGREMIDLHVVERDDPEDP